MSNAAVTATVLAALFLGFGAVDGFRKGLVKKGIAFAFSILTLVIVYFISPYVSDALKNILPGGLLSENLAGTDSEIYRMLMLSGLGDVADELLMTFVARALSIILTYIVIRIVLWTLLLSLEILSGVPGLSLLNRLAGAAFGLLQQLLTLWLFFLVVAIFSNTSWGSFLYGVIQESDWLLFLYENNLFLLVGILLFLKI